MLAIPEPLEGTKLRIATARVFAPLLAPARYKGAYGGRGSGKSHFFGELMAGARAAIEAGDYASYAKAALSRMRGGESDTVGTAFV